MCDIERESLKGIGEVCQEVVEGVEIGEPIGLLIEGFEPAEAGLGDSACWVGEIGLLEQPFEAG